MQPSPLDRWLHEPEAIIAALHDGRQDGVAPEFDPQALAFAILRPEGIAAAVLDRSGGVVAANDVFRTSGAGAEIDLDSIREAASGQRNAISLSSPQPDGLRRATAYGSAAEARHWALPAELRPALESRSDAVVMLSVAAATAGDAVRDACASFGLTELQTRVVAGLIRTGDVKSAALAAGIAYETARKTIAEAMKRTGAARLTALVASIVRLAFGVWPEGREGDAMLRDVWGLSSRQAQLALGMAQGLSRAEAAKAAGLSDAVAKKELSVVFAALDVRTGAELARAITEARALALLTRATGHQIPAESDFMEPLRIVHRPDGAQIAFSDYGPASGVPVLIIHSSSASRQAPGRLVRALQQRGFRPLAIDRPGFGLTADLVDLAAWRADPFAAACEDIRIVCRHLKLSRIDLVARGGAQVALALAWQSPDLVRRVVLVNPDPPSTASGSGRGGVGAVKEAFYRFPHLVERVTAMVASQLTPARARGIVIQSIRSSPPDLQAMEDPRNYADYARGFRLFTTGRVRGYVTEQRAMRDWKPSGTIPAAGNWRVLMGDVDPLHEPARTYAYWRDILPGTPIDIVPDAGRFLVMTHAEAVADALATLRAD